MFNVMVEPKAWGVDYIAVNCPFCGEFVYDEEVNKPGYNDSDTDLLTCPGCLAMLVLRSEFRLYAVVADELDDLSEAGPAPFTLKSAVGLNHVPLFRTPEGAEFGSMKPLCPHHYKSFTSGVVKNVVLTCQCKGCQQESTAVVYPIRIVGTYTLHAFKE